MLTKLKLKNFTAFSELNINFSSGVNVLLGANGTGKTHLLKLLYSSCDISVSEQNFANKLIRVFLPSEGRLGRLSRRCRKSTDSTVEIFRNIADADINLKLEFTNHSKDSSDPNIKITQNEWQKYPLNAAFIPVKDMMANAPGFRSLYSMRQVHFEEIYADIIDRAFLAPLRGPAAKERTQLLKILQKSMDGTIIERKEEFFLKNKSGELEFTLLSEGLRKLGLIWLLIQNGVLSNGSAIFWDEPEANLNPSLLKTVIGILVKLHRLGVQVFVATHNYVVLKEFALQCSKTDKLVYHALFNDEPETGISHSMFNRLEDVQPNLIDDTFADIIDREMAAELEPIFC
jgi:predicted ATPase